MTATERLGQVFREASASYKFFWFLGLLDTLPSLHAPVPVTRIAQAMIVRAWPMVVYHRLSLGRIDRLQTCIQALRDFSLLDGRASPQAIAAAMENWDGFAGWAQELTRFVPGRFLGPWYPSLARERPYDRRGARDVALASNEDWGKEMGAPYRLFSLDGMDALELDPRWRFWLSENLAIVQGFAEQALCHYLQARNPSVPGIVEKMRAPRRRSLAQARNFWSAAIERSRASNEPLLDIYSGAVLGSHIDIDHFLPWAFVAHDEIWNLVPVPPRVNRSKGDAIPDLDQYLTRLADFHHQGLVLISTDKAPPAAYLEFFCCGEDVLRSLGLADFREQFSKVCLPLAQIARNQGFPGNWRFGGQ